MLYLEDLNIGDHFKSREYEMTLDEIKNFAGQYDPQIFHVDEEKAKDHPIFQGLAASGWHTAAVTMRLWTECLPIAQGLIGVDVNLRWPQPTRVGDRIHVEVEIVDIQPSKRKNDRGMVTYLTHAKNQNGQDLMVSTTKVLVFRREALSLNTELLNN